MHPKTATPNSTELRQEIPIPHGKMPARWAKKHPPLDMVTRTHVDTNSAAYYLNRQPQTLRGWHCHGHFPTDGLRPLVLNGRLAWSVAAIKAAMGGAAQ
jgi:hypothetical protein